ncbi:nuclear transport factor 2 family protein [Sphingomonas sp. MG17]|uniref:Nuclear transport factor 2 family protein n=1 Tax=Sphingomonas tagetis TaxID=2949092 RepID=A0A9X2HME1_9SPHN|nr:nuclear transport factor 2 family protein [Sphingomonas tagetis]MCP3730008.1 nuclear transport factor 2 family protein [Sphingomonas tagetis]
MDDTAKLQTLWDERAINQVMLAFGHSLDARDAAAHAACFTDPVNINFKAFTGRDEVRVPASLWAQFGGFILADAPSHHILGNFKIAIDGDRASARVYMISSLWTGADRAGNRQYGWYDVWFERAGDEWQISRLKHEFQGVEGNAAGLENHDPAFAAIAQQVFSPANVTAAQAWLDQMGGA